MERGNEDIFTLSILERLLGKIKVLIKSASSFIHTFTTLSGTLEERSPGQAVSRSRPQHHIQTHGHSHYAPVSHYSKLVNDILIFFFWFGT